MQVIVLDNDSTIRAHLQHIGNDTGKLPLHLHKPVFLCDPSYRIKVMVKDIFGLVLMSQKESECEKINAMHLKKYMGYMIGKQIQTCSKCTS